jgi:HK97 gp10 family phage protein
MAINVLGVPETKAQVARIPDVFRERMNDATEVTAKEVARGAQARLLASPSIRTRNLYNAVAAAMNRRTGKGKAGISAGTTVINGIRVKGLVTAGAGGSALKSAGARYDNPAKRAHFVEFGTVHMKAEPFMIPAADAEKAPYLQRCNQAGKLAERDLSAGRNL